MKNLSGSFESLVSFIKSSFSNNKTLSPFVIATHTLYFIRHYISSIKSPTLESLSTFSPPSPLSPTCLIIHNTLHRLSKLIKEEQIHSTQEDSIDLKQIILLSIGEYLDELDGLYATIAPHSLHHIHSSELILTIGYSKTLLNFLQYASKSRQFTVIVAETSPSYKGHRMAKELSESLVETIVVSDASVFALMSRVNKVVLGTHAVLANGGLVATSGSKGIVVSAKYHSTPVVVCCGLYKLSAKYPFDIMLSDGSPVQVLDWSKGGDGDVVNGELEYIEPEYVDLFVTNAGDHPPSYVYRLLFESYDTQL